MGGEDHTAVLAVASLALRIKQLELEEQCAILRRDWSGARNVVLQRAPLKEVRQRTAALKQR